MTPKTLFLKIFRSMPVKLKIIFGVIIIKIKGYTFSIADNEEDLNNVFKIRYQIYFSEGYIQEKDNLMFSDKHDKYSANFIARDKSGKPIGAMRLAMHNPFGFPAEMYFNIKCDIDDKQTVAEPSRLVVLKELRKGSRFIMLGLAMIAYKYSKSHNIKYWIATLPEKLALSFARDFNFKFDRIDELPPSEENIKNRTEIAGYFKKEKLLPYLLKL